MLATSISRFHTDGFLSVGEIKFLDYETPLDTEEELVTRVAAAAMVIFQTLGIFERIRQSLGRRCHFCVEVNDKQFQRL